MEIRIIDTLSSSMNFIILHTNYPQTVFALVKSPLTCKGMHCYLLVNYRGHEKNHQYYFSIVCLGVPFSVLTDRVECTCACIGLPLVDLHLFSQCSFSLVKAMNSSNAGIRLNNISRNIEASVTVCKFLLIFCYCYIVQVVPSKRFG